MNNSGACIFQPNERDLANFGVKKSGDYGNVRWIGTAVPVALFICALPRSGIFTICCFIILIVGVFFDIASYGLTDKIIRILTLMPFLLLLECAILYSCTGAAKFVYYITDLGIVVKLRPVQSRMWIWGFAFSSFKRDADNSGELFYGYDEIQAVDVRRWFFDLGNLEFKIKRCGKETGSSVRQIELVSGQSVSESNVEKLSRARDFSSNAIRFGSHFAIFPGGNHGATMVSAPADFRLGFYGIRNVPSVLQLLESQCSAK